MTGGFTAPKTVFRLRFAAPELEDLQVKVRAMTIADMMDIVDDFNGDILFNGELTPAMAANTPKLFEWFLTFLVDWNLEEESGEPVPQNIDGLTSQEFPFVMTLVTTWLSASAGVTVDLKDDSPSGPLSLEESIPMEVSSPSPPS